MPSAFSPTTRNELPGGGPVKICDLTQFYSPVSGGVKRYLAEKVRYVRAQPAGVEHVLIIPGERDAVVHSERASVHTIGSPLLSRTSRYRALLRLEAIERILEQERPDIIECGDPYQVAWKAVNSGAALGIPVVGFYHSHFPEAYLRTTQKFLGAMATEWMMDFSRSYIRNLYNRMARTLVPSPALGAVLRQWGVNNVFPTNLGVDTEIFRPQPEQRARIRSELGIAPGVSLLLYVGRLAQEKNTRTLFAAFAELAQREPGRFHLLVVGDGLQRKELEQLRGRLAESTLTWFPYCEDPHRLAELYVAADFFVHPGVQETFGLVTLEAQACGTPVVGIRGSYMDRIIQSDQTLWARENSPSGLAGAIVESLGDPGLAQSSARLHGRVAAQYGWVEVFERLFSVYRQIIEEFRHCP